VNNFSWNQHKKLIILIIIKPFGGFCRRIASNIVAEQAKEGVAN